MLSPRMTRPQELKHFVLACVRGQGSLSALWCSLSVPPCQVCRLKDACSGAWRVWVLAQTPSKMEASTTMATTAVTAACRRRRCRPRRRCRCRPRRRCRRHCCMLPLPLPAAAAAAAAAAASSAATDCCCRPPQLLLPPAHRYDVVIAVVVGSTVAVVAVVTFVVVAVVVSLRIAIIKITIIVVY